MYNPFYKGPQESTTSAGTSAECANIPWEEPKYQGQIFETQQGNDSTQDFGNIKMKNSSQTESSRLSRQIFVGGLPTNVTPPLFREWAEIAFPGRVVNAVLVVDRLTHTRSRGFGFVTFDSNEMVEIASRMRLLQFAGKIVEVKKAENVSISQRKKINGPDPASGPLQPSAFNPEQYSQNAIAAAKRIAGQAARADSFAMQKPRRSKQDPPLLYESASRDRSRADTSGKLSDGKCEFLIPHGVQQRHSPSMSGRHEESRAWHQNPSTFPMSRSDWEGRDTTSLGVSQPEMAFHNQQYHEKSYHWKDESSLLPRESFTGTDQNWSVPTNETIANVGMDGTNIAEGSIGIAGLLALQASIVNMAIEDESEVDSFSNFRKERPNGNLFAGRISGTCARS